MKTAISSLIMLIAFAVELPAQCPSYPGTWNRHLSGSSYTWAFASATLGEARYTNGNLVTETDVNTAIATAVSAWTSAANQAGTRMTITPGTFGAADNINVQFGVVSGTACATTGGLTITLDNEVQYKPVGGSTGTNLNTLVLHEMGHVFLGSGHYDNDSNSIMWFDVCQPQARGLTSCDGQIVLDFYNPNYTVYVKNDFGGGNVKVEGTTYNDIPANGQSFTWRESTFPRTIEAINRQYILDQSNGKYYYRIFQD